MQASPTARRTRIETPETGRSPKDFTPKSKSSKSRSSRKQDIKPISPGSSQRPDTVVRTEAFSSVTQPVLSTPDDTIMSYASYRISSNSEASFEQQAPTQSLAPSQSSFPSAVATPPIVESDLEPFASLPAPLLDTTSLARPITSSAEARGASLPSPGLSPTVAAADSQVALREADFRSPSGSNMSVQRSLDQSSELLQLSKRGGKHTNNINAMLENFDAMPEAMKTYMAFQMLKRCSKKTLQIVADIVNPALECDFLDALPMELSLQILSLLDLKDLCRAAQVSRRWRSIVNENETGWKELLLTDNFVLPPGELDRAITEGWGWQDPHGCEASERDLSDRPHSSRGSASSSLRPVVKRKRAQTGTGTQRSKRRAIVDSNDKLRFVSVGSHYSGFSEDTEGPNAAAAAALMAVPSPDIGLESLGQMHLYKSLYRRRYMLKRSWMMNGVVEPRHVAFAAHPRHVITCLQFDDDKIVTGSDDTYMHVYDTATGALRKRLEGHEGGVWALQYQCNVLVSGSTDRSVRVWDIAKGVCTQIFHGHTSTVRCLQIVMPVATGEMNRGRPVFAPEKPLIITGSRDQQLKVWRLPQSGDRRYTPTIPPMNDFDCPFFVRTLSGHTSSVRAIAAHQDTLVSGSYDNTVRVWKISTGESVHRLVGHNQKVYSVVLDHKRNRCISGSMDNTVKIWCLETGTSIYTLDGHTSLVGLLDLKDDRLVSAAADSTLRIWDPQTGQCKNTLTAHTGAITCFQHDGQKVVSGSDRTLKMWNVTTGAHVKDLLTELSGVWQVKFDERRCVAAVQRNGFTYIEVRTPIIMQKTVN